MTAATKAGDNSGPDLSDSTFWFSEHQIPQYELLVREGAITQAQADSYREQRSSVGLPMKVSEVKANFHPAFRWLEDVGGPNPEPGRQTHYMGITWLAWAFGERGLLAADHPRHAQGSRLTVDGGAKAGQINWSVTISIAAGVTASRSGMRTSFEDAVNSALECEFGAIEFAGIAWVEDAAEGDEGWVAAVDGRALRVRYLRLCGDDGRWIWSRGIDRESPEAAIAAIFRESEFSGSASSRADAVSEALEAPSRLRRAAADLFGGDEFQAGRLAGIAEAKACLQSL